jgi:hypothetical protein
MYDNMAYSLEPTYIPDRFLFFPRRTYNKIREHQLSGILALCEYLEEKIYELETCRVYLQRERRRHLYINIPMGKVMRNGLLPEAISHFSHTYGMVMFVPGYPRSDAERTEVVVKLPPSFLSITSLYKEKEFSSGLRRFIALMRLFMKMTPQKGS